jgi:hypothetical protein
MMPQSQNAPSNPATIQQPPCPECNAQMRLTQIVPEGPSYDRRDFECPECQHTESSIVKFWG